MKNKRADKHRQRYLAKLRKQETPATKLCPCCEKILPLVNFHKQVDGRKGLQVRCKLCMQDYSHKKRLDNYNAHTLKWLELRDQEGTNEKICKECLIIKPLSAFHKGNRKGRGSICKQCHKAKYKYDPQAARESKLKRKYGMTLDQYDQMLVSQGECCAICGTNVSDHIGRFVVDHNHETGCVPALLCNNCNTALGLFKDDPETLRKATRYLETHK